MVSCTFVTRATCLLALMVYKYNELEVSFATQKLSLQGQLQNTFFHFVLYRANFSTNLLG
jgi:hypothetical protein